jgi:UDP-glucose 4-epimerase
MRQNVPEDANGKWHRGTGYIGSFTSLALLENGYQVVIVDSLYNSSKVSLDRIELLCGKRPDFYQVDITDEEALDKVFAAHPNIDSVIHFASLKVNLAQEIRREN